MKLVEIVDARFAFQKLVVQDLPLDAALYLMQLIEKCNVYLKFYENELNKFDNLKEPDRLKSIQEMEIDEPFCKVKIQVDETLKLSATDVKHLMPFIDFIVG